MPLGCIVCTALIVSQPLVYPYTNGNFGHIGVVSISRIWRGASLVARFDKQGHSYEPQNVKRATVQGFTLSFCLYITLVETRGCCSPRP